MYPAYQVQLQVVETCISGGNQIGSKEAKEETLSLQSSCSKTHESWSDHEAGSCFLEVRKQVEILSTFSSTQNSQREETRSIEKE